MNVDELDIEKLKLVLVDLSKPSNVVNNDAVKKKLCKGNSIDTNEFLLKIYD